MRTLIPRFNSFREIFSIDYRSLALLRFGIAFVSIYDLICAWPVLRAFYSDWGVLPRSALFTSSTWSFYYLSIYNISGVPFVLNLLFIIHLLVSLMLLFGFRTRLAAFLTWFFTISLIARNPMAITGAYVIFRMGLFWCMFLPLGAKWSVDSALNNLCDSPKKLLNTTFLSPATLGVMVQIIITYFFAGILKNDPIWDKDFTGIYYSLHIDQFATHFGKFLLNFPEFLKIITMYTVYLQRYGIILFFIPIKNNYFKLLGIFLFCFFHIGLNLSMNIGWFQVIAMVMLSVFVPTTFWDWIIKKLSTPKRSGVKIYYDNDCSFCKRTVFILSTLFLVPATQLLPAQGTRRINKIMESENSWVVVDFEGNKRIKFDALIYVFSVSPILFPLKYLKNWKSFFNLGDRSYSFVANHRPFFSRITEFLKFRPMQTGSPFPIISYPIALFVIGYCLFWNIADYDKWKEEEEKDNINIPANMFWIGPTFQLYQYWGLFAPKPMAEDGWFIVSAVTKGGRQFDLYTGEDLTWDKPAHVSGTFPNDRWRKYLMNMWLGQFSDHRLHYGRYLCREWNADHHGDQQVDSFYIYYMLEETPPPNEEFPELKSAMLHEHYCFPPEENNDTSESLQQK